MFGSVRFEPELVLAKNLARRSSIIRSAELVSIRPAWTRLESRYSAKLCSKLRSAYRLGDWLGESEHSSA